MKVHIELQDMNGGWLDLHTSDGRVVTVQFYEDPDTGQVFVDVKEEHDEEEHPGGLWDVVLTHNGMDPADV